VATILNYFGSHLTAVLLIHVTDNDSGACSLSESVTKYNGHPSQWSEKLLEDIKPAYLLIQTQQTKIL
jgi:hypothetical protein